MLDDWSTIIELNETKQICDYNCSKIEFNISERNSLITEWNLTCDKKWLSDLTYSMSILSGALTSPFLGLICDKFGRKPTIYICIILTVIVEWIGSILPDYIAYSIFTVIGQVFYNAAFVALTVLCNELVGQTKRAFVSAIFAIGTASLLVLLATISYLSSSWRYIKIIGQKSPYLS